MKILILTIATNKYIQFVERLYDNIEDKFLSDYNMTRVETDWAGDIWGDALYIKKQ